MDTIKGGYYVNKGLLEFKQIDTDWSDEETGNSDEEIDYESDKNEQEENVLSTLGLNSKSSNSSNPINNIINKPTLISRSEASNPSPVVRLSQGGVPPSRRILSSEFMKTDFN